jgi:hypothetical protein
MQILIDDDTGTVERASEIPVQEIAEAADHGGVGPQKVDTDPSKIEAVPA